jgi:hypothetical protein
MLEIGNGGMTDTEYRAHFSLWAIMAAPLLVGTDLRAASPATLDILTNKDVIAIDQDPLGKQGSVVSNNDGHWVFAKPLENGDVAVTLFNETASAAPITTTASAVGMPQKDGYVLHDLWSKQATETVGTIGANVPAHGTVMYRVVADPNWRDYPPATSFSASVSAPAQGQSNSYVIPGKPFTVTGAVSNYGGVTGESATLQLTGPSSFDGVTYEAEAGTLNGAARADDCGACSGGSKVRFIGNGADNWARLDGVAAPAAGTYDVTVYAATSGTRSLWLSVNGGPGMELMFSGSSFDSPVPVKVSVPLNAGANSLRLYNDTAYGPDFDRVVIGGGTNPSGWTISPSDPVTTPALGAGQTLSVDWTVTPPANAQPGAYHLTVQGRLGEQNYSVPITVVVPSARLETGWVSDQQWLEAQSFWGPIERDRSNGERDAGDGHTLTIGGKTYAKGLGVHAPSSILFFNGGHCSSITSDVGVDDEKSGAGSVEFQIWADRRLLADSGVVTWQDAAKTLTANIGNTDFVQLVVLDGGDTNSDHSDWAGLQVTCGGSTTTPGDVGGTVPATLTLTLGPAAAFGAFTPGVDGDYTATQSASVISTAGDASLTVSDPSSNHTGHLVNGSFALPSPLLAAGHELPSVVQTWAAPVTNDPVTIAFTQHIGAGDALRTGTYAKTLTFTLSTTNP